MASAASISRNKLSLVLVTLSVASAVALHRTVPAVHEGGPWGLLTVFAGTFALLHGLVAAARAKKAPGELWPAWPAALMAVATMAAGAAGAAASRQTADGLAQFVDQAFAGPDRDEEEVAIQTAYVRAQGYGAGRASALIGLGVGVPALGLALMGLEQARRARNKQPPDSSGAGPGFWMVLCGSAGAVALAAAIAAAARPVPGAEHPDLAEAALIERRFAAGELPGACRLLKGALQATTQQAQRQAEGRIAQVREKAARCVELELQRARKLGATGCEAAVEALQSKHLVEVSGRREALSSACSGLQ